MSDDKTPDPGWWRRGMTPRAQTIVFVVAGAALAGVLIFAVASGISIF